eukprot:Gregarina_sp_Poly_1__4511@NODE_2423_length_2152_cov_115_596163_g1540_i0_p2_GENE_NODE_2423_length_2152_cov_115_596163_g1540_i0NODE_2423_length_2152_cov_115_596163_g1540_i0_p2_ORF_typecomplete_len241_score44_99_NODE_2423_length_2152_cov_115_596163_g1540_i096818
MQQSQPRMTSSGNLEEKTTFVEVEFIKEKIIEKPVYEKYVKDVFVKKINLVKQDTVVERQIPNFYEKQIEVPELVQKRVPVPRKLYKQVPIEQMYKVPRIETKIVHEEVQVPGAIFEVAKPVIREVKQTVYNYIDKETPTTVGISVNPIVEENKDKKMIQKAKKYTPYVVPVEMLIPVPVNRPVDYVGSHEEQRPTDMTPAQFNAQVKAQNPGLSDEHLMSLYQRNADGSVPMMNAQRMF